VRYLYNPKMYGDSAPGGPSSFYAYVNSVDDTLREKVVTVSRTVGRCFWAMPGQALTGRSSVGTRLLITNHRGYDSRECSYVLDLFQIIQEIKLGLSSFTSCTHNPYSS
jgi:hypothetical protein